jgi:outer membrane lipoprotein-sorting protein
MKIMKTKIFQKGCTTAMIFFMSAGLSFAQLTANQVLQKVDDVINGASDQDMRVKTVLIEKNGKESVREMTMLQKGSHMRLVKFLTPADQKGIGLLSLPKDDITLYLPAFQKTRKIASSAKNGKFAGTDFTMEDMEAKKYADKWIPKILASDKISYTLELTPLPGIKTEYSKLVMTLGTSNFYPTKIEHYDKGGKLIKILNSNRIEKSGKYLVAREVVMSDLRTGTKTKFQVITTKFDSGLTDDKFTERELMK